MRNDIMWCDPRDKLWGFHIHQELPLKDFTIALITQQHCAEFLNNNNISIDEDDVIKPGYGPHLEYLWELRIESPQKNILEKMGQAISFMAVNRHNLSAYIHPLMHDSSLPTLEALAAEGHYNQKNTLWFGSKVVQNQDFFFNPPKDKQHQLIDTRTSRILSSEEKEELRYIGRSCIRDQLPCDPYKMIKGFHIHMDYATADEALALIIYDKFLIFLLKEHLRPTSTRLYGPRENGPHILGGWEVKFETNDPLILEKIGVAIGWLMCNRQGLPAFIHPVTWKEGDYQEELKAHEEYPFFLEELPELDLSFFSR